MEPDRREQMQRKRKKREETSHVLTRSYPQPMGPQLTRRKSYSYAVLEMDSVSSVYKKKSLILRVPN
jgi:hypothetical protein